jgi:hypothetical protein
MTIEKCLAAAGGVHRTGPNHPLACWLWAWLVWVICLTLRSSGLEEVAALCGVWTTLKWNIVNLKKVSEFWGSQGSVFFRFGMQSESTFFIQALTHSARLEVVGSPFMVIQSTETLYSGIRRFWKHCRILRILPTFFRFTVFHSKGL